MMPADKRDDSPRCGYGRSWVDFGRNFLRCEAVIYVFDHGVSKELRPANDPCAGNRSLLDASIDVRSVV